MVLGLTHSGGINGYSSHENLYGDVTKETHSYYGSSLALLRLPLPPPLPYFRRSGHMRPLLYADAYNSTLLALSCLPPALHHYLAYYPLPPPPRLPPPLPVHSLAPLSRDSREATWS